MKHFITAHKDINLKLEKDREILLKCALVFPQITFSMPLQIAHLEGLKHFCYIYSDTTGKKGWKMDGFKWQQSGTSPSVAEEVFYRVYYSIPSDIRTKGIVPFCYKHLTMLQGYKDGPVLVEYYTDFNDLCFVRPTGSKAVGLHLNIIKQVLLADNGTSYLYPEDTGEPGLDPTTCANILENGFCALQGKGCTYTHLLQRVSKDPHQRESIQPSSPQISNTTANTLLPSPSFPITSYTSGPQPKITMHTQHQDSLTTHSLPHILSPQPTTGIQPFDQHSYPSSLFSYTHYTPESITRAQTKQAITGTSNGNFMENLTQRFFDFKPGPQVPKLSVGVNPTPEITTSTTRAILHPHTTQFRYRPYDANKKDSDS